MHIYSFEKLEVWQEAGQFVGNIYRTTALFPPDERFGLTAQERKAAVTLESAIAEGSGRKTVNDQAHFYRIAYSSLLEVLNQLILSNDLGFKANEDLVELRADIEKIANKLNKLSKSIKA